MRVVMHMLSSILADLRMGSYCYLRLMQLAAKMSLFKLSPILVSAHSPCMCVLSSLQMKSKSRLLHSLNTYVTFFAYENSHENSHENLRNVARTRRARRHMTAMRLYNSHVYSSLMTGHGFKPSPVFN